MRAALRHGIPLVLALLGAGCTTYTSEREEVRSTSPREVVGPLRSATPVRSERARTDVVDVRLEGDLLVVQTESRRERSYEATLHVLEDQVVRHARVDWLIWDTGTHMSIQVISALISPPMFAVFNLAEQLSCFSRAGDALDGELTPGTHPLGNDRLVVRVVDVHRLVPSDAPATSRVVDRTTAGPEPDADVTLTFEQARGELHARTDASGRARFSLVDVADVAIDGAILIACPPAAPTRRELPAGFVERLRALRGRPVDAPATAVPPGIAEQVDAGREAEAAGDLPGAIRRYGGALAADPAAGSRLGLARLVPLLLSRLDGPLPVPPRALAASDEGFAALGLASPDLATAEGRAREAVAEAPWWSGGHRLAAATLALAARRDEARRELALALALSPAGSDEAHDLRALLVRWSDAP